LFSGFADDETFVAFWSLSSCIDDDDGDILVIVNMLTIVCCTL